MVMLMTNPVGCSENQNFLATPVIYENQIVSTFHNKVSYYIYKELAYALCE